MKHTMNLAAEFKEILENYGSDVLVIRQDKRTRCSCYNEVTQEVSRACPLCLGLGFSYIAERHRVRTEDVLLTQDMANVLKTSMVGGYTTGDRRFFTLPSLKAQERDLVVLVDWDSQGRPLYKENGIWAIKNVDKTQTLGDNEIIYQVLYGSVTPVRSKIRGLRIGEMNGVKQYHILMEG